MNGATRFVDSAVLLLADGSWLPRMFAMPKKVSACIQDHFVELSDPRRRKVTDPLINIVTIAICAVICGADDFVSIAEFGRKKRRWLAQFLDLRNGIPSHDRFNASFGAIKPAEFEACLLSWITALHEITSGQIVANDGKILRRSFDTASSKSAIHMVTRGAAKVRRCLSNLGIYDKQARKFALCLTVGQTRHNASLFPIIERRNGAFTPSAVRCLHPLQT
jgi:hypothetical protein